MTDLQDPYTYQIHHLNEYYKYPRSNKRYKLIEVDRWRYIFEDGHRVTDNVFCDLIRCKTGIQVYNEVQMEMF
jgi:hypothetical protein